MWANKSNYSSCQPLEDLGFPSNDYGVDISEYTSIIYFTGYTVSIVALTLAVWIFIHFKSVSFCLISTFISLFARDASTGQQIALVWDAIGCGYRPARGVEMAQLAP